MIVKAEFRAMKLVGLARPVPINGQDVLAELDPATAIAFTRLQYLSGIANNLQIPSFFECPLRALYCSSSL
jgi:hypothetical protein